MQLRNILCPVDFSEPNKGTLDLASRLAGGSGATLHIVHVTLPAVPFGSEHLYMMTNTIEDEIRQMMDKIRPTDPTISVQHHVIEGHPADALVQFAQDMNVDLIVMATHGRTGIARLLMGSVAENVIRRAQCPVLAVKLPSGSAASSSNNE